MRSNSNFIEVTGVHGDKKFLVNKSAIIFIMPAESETQAVIMTVNGDKAYRILTRESYNDIAEEILWNGWNHELDGEWLISRGEKAPEEEIDV